MIIPELSHFALILAFCFALIQAVILWFTPHPTIGKSLAFGQFFWTTISYIGLTYAFIANDFSVAYVAENSNSSLPFGFRVAAVWGAHEGSLLLWIWLLSGWTMAVSFLSRRLPNVMRAHVLAVLGCVSVGFLLFLLYTSNPFLRVLTEIPVNGRDLNPLLQDIGLISHPPMLYMGYVGTSVAFAFAIAALIDGKLEAAYAQAARPWTLIAWSFLTLGILLGSWWAYRELGWGGWWFWDPVENASLLPWLVTTALIHSLIATEKRAVFKGWTALLAITSFSLSLVGAFLVRSGVLTSVHSFANDPARGAFLLKFLVIIIGGALLIYAIRATAIRSHATFQMLSRETLLLANNILLMVAMLTVLLGTLYPLILEVMSGEKISVGEPYFNAVFVPIMIPLLVCMGIGPACYWSQMPAKLLLQRLRYNLICSVLLALILPWIFIGQLSGAVVLGLALAFWIICTTLQDVYRRMQSHVSLAYYGMVFAHIGLAICIIGMTLTTAYSIERDVRLAPGEQVQLSTYTFKFLRTEPLTGPNYSGTIGVMQISQQGQEIAVLKAEKRLYTVRKMVMTRAAINVSMFRDLYVSLGEPLDQTAWSWRLYDKPFVRWLWIGALIMVLGGCLAATRKRN